ncbi:MAG: HEAT repeat domain-containing protein [Lachnospiraceae bacterium]|nr:HEAT repeat domain-containing protein [Lachnospiraceae bacterium]
MGSEVLLYGYGIVCLSMLIYNIIYNIIMKGKDRRAEKREQILRKKICIQIDRLKQGQAIETGHFEYMRTKLSNVSYLIAFYHAMKNLQEEPYKEGFSEYGIRIQPTLIRLAVVYKERESMQAAYFAYVLSRLQRLENGYIDKATEEILVNYMKKDSLYCRVNALQALCNIGTPEGVFKALRLLDLRDGVLHDKVMTDILLSYKGEHGELIGCFLKHFEEVSPRVQLPVMNYIRFCSDGCREKFYEILIDEKRDKELRMSAIRYFGKYYYEKAKDSLIAFVKDPDPLKWEYAAAAVSALAFYDGEDVIDTLTGAVHSTNWYIRYNAAESLTAHQLDYSDLIGIVGGTDRFAREMVMYRLEEKRMEEEAVDEAKMQEGIMRQEDAL